SPAAVKRAAFACFGIGGIAGIALSLTSAPWLILVGLACVAGAWFYTGGSKPYGYLGFGEIAVFVFFGLVAVLGTEFVQAGRVDVAGALAACAVGSYSSAVLVANNLRDIPTDRESGKITLAVRLGDSRTRALFAVLVAVPTVLGLALAAVATPWALLSLVSAPLAVRAALPVLRGGQGPALIPALAQTGLAMLVWSIGAAIGLFLGA
ncbi:1,4-dihydroxy-2-naphthoate polyprenyltransferase, partial [Tsukamurella pulmonis]